MSLREPLGVLSTLHHPLLPYFLDALAPLEATVEPVVLLDRRDFAPKDLKIFEARTQGAFPAREPAEWLKRYRHDTVDDHNACGPWMRAQGIRLLANAGTPRRLSAELLRAAAIGVLNVHPGLLPKYRGATCCEWAIYRDDPIGVTAHFMDEGIDSGPIVLTRRLAVRKGQTYSEVRVALYRLAHAVGVEAIRMVMEQGMTRQSLPPQPDAGACFHAPMPDGLLEQVKDKLHKGTYAYAD